MKIPFSLPIFSNIQQEIVFFFFFKYNSERT